MSSQPSQAHILAMDAVEIHAQKTLEAEIKRLVERPESFLLKDSAAAAAAGGDGQKNPEASLIETIHNQIKGKKQMDKMLELASESE